MTRLTTLYPRAWRDRYEVEFLALMADRSSRPRDRIDIVRGALDARLHPQLGPTGSGATAPAPLARLGGLGAIIGGLLWVAAGIGFHVAPFDAAEGYKDTDSLVLVTIAAAFVSGLSAIAIARLLPGQHALLSISAVAALLGAVLLAFPWPVLLIGFWTTIIGTVSFGFAALPRLGSPGLALGVLALLALGFNTETAAALLLIPLGVAWILLGAVLAFRGVPSRGELQGGVG